MYSGKIETVGKSGAAVEESAMINEVDSYCCDICGWCDTCQPNVETRIGKFDLCRRHNDAAILKWAIKGAPHYDPDLDIMEHLNLVIIGHSGSITHDPRMALFAYPKNRSGGRLRAFLAVRHRTYYAIDRRNLFQTTDKQPIAAAREAANKMLPSLQGRRVILLGNEVAAAFNADHFQRNTWYLGYNINMDVEKMAVVPHPSPASRIWSDRAKSMNARRFLLTVGANLEKRVRQLQHEIKL